MSDSEASSVSRPKRSALKQSDDNILGISWKEERELRKAMYVSLRQQQKPETNESRKLRPRTTSSKPSGNVLLQWYRQSSTTEYKIRASKISATLRSVTTAAMRKSTRSSVANPSTSTKELRNSVLCKRTGKSRIRQMRSTQNKEIRRPTSNELKSTSQTSPTAFKLVKPNDVSNSPRKRPTLMSASNGDKATTKRCRPDTLRQNKHARLRSPIKFASPFPQSRDSISESSIEAGSDVKCGNGSPFKLPINPARKHRPDVVGSGSSDRSVQRCVFLQDPVIRPPARISGAVVPAELCQDPRGRPVSVHDFVDFVCYRGTPFLESRLEWFDIPQTLRSRSDQSQQKKSACSDKSDTELRRSVANTNSGSPSKPAVIPIAKKLPSMNQSS